MRHLAAILAFTVSIVIAPLAAADDPPVTTPDPSAYAATVAQQMVEEGTDPLRATFVVITGSASGQLPVNIETNLAVFERAIARRPATIWRKLDDVTLSDSVRHIYYYHYYGDNAWLYTRYEFLLIDEGKWALTVLSFTSDWSTIVAPTTAGFRASR